jgi:septum formation protein
MLLKQIGIVPDQIVSPDIDETPQRDELPRPYAMRMARAKAAAVQTGDHLVLAADTVVAVGRRILPKAETEQQARECLTLLSGRRHKVVGGIALSSPGGKLRLRLVETAVRFKRLETSEIDRYIQSGEWQGKAGGYAIQGRAALFIAFISGSYSNVVGLPLFETAALLRST